MQLQVMHRFRFQCFACHTAGGRPRRSMDVLQLPVIEATPENFEGYGTLISGNSCSKPGLTIPFYSHVSWGFGAAAAAASMRLVPGSTTVTTQPEFICLQVEEGHNLPFVHNGRCVVRTARIHPAASNEVSWIERHVRMTQVCVTLYVCTVRVCVCQVCVAVWNACVPSALTVPVPSVHPVVTDNSASLICLNILTYVGLRLCITAFSPTWLRAMRPGAGPAL